MRRGRRARPSRGASRAGSVGANAAHKRLARERAASGVGRLARAALFGNVFIAAGGALWTYSTYRVLGLASNPALVALVFAGTLAVYTFDRLFTFERYDGGAKTGAAKAAGRAATPSERHRWIESHRRPLAALLGASASAAALCALAMRWRVLAALAVLGAVSAAYSLPVLRGRTVGLKSVGWLKTPLVAVVWALVTTALPALDATRGVGERDSLFLLAERFLFVFAITLPFDVRDAALDASVGIRTIPVAAGLAATRGIVVGLLAAYVVVKAAHYGPSNPAAFGAALVSAAYALALVPWLGARDDEYFYGVLWDGAIFVQAIASLVALDA